MYSTKDIESEWFEFAGKAAERICEDVEFDREKSNGEGYLGFVPPHRPPPERAIHTLEVPGKKGQMNIGLLKHLARACADWHFAHGSPQWRDLQLREVKRVFFPTDRQKAIQATMRERRSFELEKLEELILKGDSRRHAKVFFLASIAVLDAIRTTMPVKEHEKLEKRLYNLLATAFTHFDWKVSQETKENSNPLIQSARIVDTIEQWWEEKEDVYPLQENIYRAAYRLGVMFDFEKPFKNNPMYIPTSDEVFGRFDSRTRSSLRNEMRSQRGKLKERAPLGERSAHCQCFFVAHHDWDDPSTLDYRQFIR